MDVSAEWSSLVAAVAAEGAHVRRSLPVTPIRRRKKKAGARARSRRPRGRSASKESAGRSSSPSAAPVSEEEEHGDAAVAAGAPTRWPRARLLRAYGARAAREPRRRADERDVEDAKKHPLPLPGHVGYDAEETRAELEARLGRPVTLAAARALMRRAGANHVGCIGADDLDQIVFDERRAPWSKRRLSALRSQRAPTERYVAPLAVDCRALAAPLGRPVGVNWAYLVAMLDGNRDFARDVRDVRRHSDRQFTQTTLSGRHTILHYLANKGAVANIREILVRDAARALVDNRDASGHTAMDYAVARADEPIIDTLSCYHGEHLANEHVNHRHRNHLDLNTLFSARSGRTYRDR